MDICNTESLLTCTAAAAAQQLMLGLTSVPIVSFHRQQHRVARLIFVLKKECRGACGPAAEMQSIS